MNKFKDEGKIAFEAGQYAEAERLFTKALEAEPNNHVIYSNRSACYANLDRLDEALADAETCISLCPDFAKGYSRKGLALFRMRKLGPALEAYQEGLKKFPDNAALKAGMEQVTKEAQGAFKQNMLWSSISRLLQNEKNARLFEEDPELLIKLSGIIQELMKDPTPEKIRLAMAMNPDPRVRQLIGEVLGVSVPRGGGDTTDMPTTSSSGRPSAERQQQASSDARAASSMESEVGPAVSAELQKAEELKQEGNEHYKKREFDKALELYEAAYQMNPSEILYLNNRAAVLLEQGKFDDAIAVCEEALEKRYEVKADFSKVAKIYNRLSACYKRKGDLEMAIKMLEKSLTEDNNRHTRTALKDLERELEKKVREAYINPEISEEKRLKGNEYFKEKNFPAAKLEYDEAIKRLPTDARLYSNRAAAFMHLLEYPSALMDCDKCLELDPKNVKGYIRKGQCHLKMKDYNKAMSAFQQGLKIEPNNPELIAGLNQTMMAIGATQTSDQVDPEQLERAMADPEIQAILADPQFRLILQQVSEKPDMLPGLLQDPKVADGLRKLMGAGILRIK